MAFIDSDNPLAAGILQEVAESYFAACSKMVESLEALSVFDREVASSAQEGELVTGRSRLLNHAAERVHFVLIQRDAMKFAWSETFFEDYEVPSDVIARLGQPPRKK